MENKIKTIEKIISLGLWGSLRLVRDLIISACIINIGSLIRYPFYIRKVGSLKIGKDFRVGSGAVIEILSQEGSLVIGHSFRAASRLHIGCISKINIGNNVLVASDVYISDHSHGNYDGSIQSEPGSIVNNRNLVAKEINISNNVWIGEKVCILPGVNIGENSIIGALSVVTKDVLPNSIYVGCPAKIIKQYDEVSKSWIKVK
jgi:lipopolysaccharide O-acetyltransferase